MDGIVPFVILLAALAFGEPTLIAFAFCWVVISYWSD